MKNKEGKPKYIRAVYMLVIVEKAKDVLEIKLR